MKLLKVLSAVLFLLILVLPAIAVADIKPTEETGEVTQSRATNPVESPSSTTASPHQPASPQAFQLNWLSINGGGAINASSTNYQLGLSVGQSVAGLASSSSYQMGIGFWYGAGAPACANPKGDLTGGGITSADAVAMLNCVYLGTGSCDFCFADVNCSGTLTSSDTVLELNRVYLGLTDPPWCGI
jgi:hypothetical protein